MKVKIGQMRLVDEDSREKQHRVGTLPLLKVCH